VVFLRLRSLKSRLALGFLLLLLLQLLTYVFLNASISRMARERVRQELTSGERIFRRLLLQNRSQLLQILRSLSGQPQLQLAIAQRDVAAALSTIQKEAGTSAVVMVVLEDKTLMADSLHPSAKGSPFPFPDLLPGPGATQASVVLMEQRAYQLVVVPVLAGLGRPPMAWVGLGIPLDDALARDIQGVTSQHVSLLTSRADGRRILASTLPPDAQGRMLNALSEEATDDPGQKATRTRLATIGRQGGTTFLAVLQPNPANEFRDPSLRLILAALGLGSIVIVLGAGFLVSAHVLRPVLAMTAFAQRIEEGDYSFPVDIRQDDEVGALAAGFNRMREGIAAREEKIVQLAYRDPLTGLPNRALFGDRLQQSIAVSRRVKRPLTILVMDLDRFKYVNDTLSHRVGDLLLQEVGTRLRATLRTSDTVARLGGDEFAILLPTAGPEAGKRVARNILDALEVPMVIEGQTVDIRASIGIASSPEHGDDAGTIMRRADVAMYFAKRGVGGFAIYDAAYEEDKQGSLSLLGELRHAVEHDELVLHYQPKVDLAAGGVAYVEALVRWQHPQRGFVAPSDFIPFAEQTGHITAITAWVLEAAIRQCSLWLAEGRPLGIAINISMRDLLNPGLPSTLSSLMRTYDVAPQWIALEITESAIMEEPIRALEVFSGINNTGVRLSLDDFGIGQSSLAYLKRFPVAELKIDKSFVMAMSDDKDDAAIVRSAIELGHNMGLRVVAEGVEDGDSLELLQSMGCDLAQGYFISRPLPADKLEKWLSESSWKSSRAVQAKRARGPKEFRA